MEASKDNVSTCLICRNCLPPEAISSVDKNVAHVFLRIFGKLCHILEVKFPVKFSDWNFDSEAFPFCKSCRSDVVRICKLQDELNGIQKQIECIAAKMAVRIIESEKKAKENKIPVAEASRVRRHQYFRNAIRRRYDVRVRLKDYLRCGDKKSWKITNSVSLRDEMSGGKDKTAVEAEKVDIEQQLVKPKMITLPPISVLQDKVTVETPLLLESESYDVDADTDPLGVIDLPRSQALVTLGTRSDNLSSGVEQTYVEIQPDETHASFYDEGNLELGNYQDDPFLMPQCDVVLEEPDVDYTYLMPVSTAAIGTSTTTTLPVSVLKPVSTLPSRSRPTFSQQEISRRLAQKPYIPAKTQNRNEVKVVDPVTNTYSYSGFNFVKHEDHCVCSTCGATLKLRALNDHHVNIRNHINAVHIGQKSIHKQRLPAAPPAPPMGHLQPSDEVILID